MFNYSSIIMYIDPFNWLIIDIDISGSILHVNCEMCEEINYIPTGKRHGTNIWDVNTKLGAGNSHQFSIYRFTLIFLRH